MREQAGVESGSPLAALILGVRSSDNDTSRTENFLFMLNWIDRHYGDLFDVLVVEQDARSKLAAIIGEFRPYVRHEFVYDEAEIIKATF